MKYGRDGVEARPLGSLPVLLDSPLLSYVSPVPMWGANVLGTDRPITWDFGTRI